MTGTYTEIQFVWNDLVEYKTLEREEIEDFSPNPIPGLPKLKWGYKIERSETVVQPIVLNVTTTEWWTALIGGIWTQQEAVTMTVEDGPWAVTEPPVFVSRSI